MVRHWVNTKKLNKHLWIRLETPYTVKYTSCFVTVRGQDADLLSVSVAYVSTAIPAVFCEEHWWFSNRSTYTWERCCFLLWFIRSVVSNSLLPHGLQHTRPPCPSPTPGAYSNSCPLNQWCHPTISSSVVPSCFQSCPASGSSLKSQLFTSGGQSIGTSASVSVLSVSSQGWFPLGWTGFKPISALMWLAR